MQDGFASAWSALAVMAAVAVAAAQKMAARNAASYRRGHSRGSWASGTWQGREDEPSRQQIPWSWLLSYSEDGHTEKSPLVSWFAVRLQSVLRRR